MVTLNNNETMFAFDIDIDTSIYPAKPRINFYDNGI